MAVIFSFQEVSRRYVDSVHALADRAKQLSTFDSQQLSAARFERVSPGNTLEASEVSVASLDLGSLLLGQRGIHHQGPLDLLEANQFLKVDPVSLTRTQRPYVRTL